MGFKISLTKGKTALVDPVDAALSLLRWHTGLCGRTAYGVHSVDERTKLLLHRAVWARAFPDQPVPEDIDHINGDGLDCRRANLRDASHQENSFNRRRNKNNSTGFAGVSYSRRDRTYKAELGSGPDRYIGSFGTAEAAARARDQVARKRLGAFAALNFPDAGERGV